MINQPAQFDFLPHYRGNGLSPWIIQLKYKDGTPVDLSGSHIRMDLKRPMRSRPEWVFNSDGSGDGLFTIIDPINGKIQFPLIKSWGLPTATYQYDLFICDANDFARAYLRGQWKVNQNISQVPCSDVSGGFSVGMASSGGSGGGTTESVVIDGQTYEVEVILIEVDYQERGENGHTPYIVDGNWWINGVDTGKRSTGEEGESAFEVWDAENGGGNTIQDYFDFLQQPAIDASVIALDSAQLADNSASNANQASDRANTSADNADIATANAVQATSEVIDATADAILATEKANNAKGWTPTSEFEEYNGKQIKRLTGYIGGTGDEPTDNVGLYYMAGGFTSDKDLAVNFKGDTVQAMIYVRDDYNQLPTPLNPNTLYFISKDA